ncbi:MAG: anthranilate synthase component I family protein [Defluviitaleaceae bacterium]|nr:anthranilate synthase component I family protein [Defluviitaleaceae bacterium]
MQKNAAFEHAKKLAETGKFNLIPISEEILSDCITPIMLLRVLQTKSTHCYLLESAEDTRHWGRYTFLGFNPSWHISCRNGDMKITSPHGEKSFKTDNPNKHIQEILDAHKSPKIEGLPPFTGGLVGYFSYEYVKYAHPGLKLGEEDHFSDVDLMLFDTVIAFDNFRHKIILIANISAENFDENYAKGKVRIEQLKNLINTHERPADKPSRLLSDFTPLFTKDEYVKIVKRAQEYIRDAETFQAVLSNRFEAEYEGSLLNTYRVLRTINPSPYMFYFSGSEFEIAGASPETLVKLQDGKLFTYPLAGTRHRGKTEAEDLELERELLANEKDLSEHNQLVDLGRDDMGKVSKIGSVTVEKYMNILRFSHVMHMGSVVSGEILPNKTALDAVNAALPAGTLSGAPKIRTMEIIYELEQNKRGIYGGSIGYLDFTGNMDICIAIRLAYKKGNKVYVRSGAGVVAESVPEDEYTECENKAKAMCKALEGFRQ